MAILRDQGFECEYVIGGVGPMQGPLEKQARELGLEKNFKIFYYNSRNRGLYETIN